jgi:CRISPR-associated endoribonuclease Cas6
MIISSPYDNFIEQISYQLEKIIDNQIPLEIGPLFELQSFAKIKNQKSPFPLQMITGSPIIIRIPIEKFKEFSTESAGYKTIYWRSSHPIQLFVDAIESNLKKKYQEFSSTKITGQLFEKFIFKKQISTKIEIENVLVPIIGSMWELGFTSSYQKKFNFLL